MEALSASQGSTHEKLWNHPQERLESAWCWLRAGAVRGSRGLEVKSSESTFCSSLMASPCTPLFRNDFPQYVTAQPCPTLCDPMDCKPPGSSVHGILQARILEWVAISLSRGSSWPRDRTQDSCIAGGFFTIWATYRTWNSLGQNTGVGKLSLLHGIFPIQG